MLKGFVYFLLFAVLVFCKREEEKGIASPLAEVKGELEKLRLDQSSLEALKRIEDYLASVNNSDREARDFIDSVKLSLIAAAVAKKESSFLSQITKTDGNAEAVRKYLSDQKPGDEGLKFAYSTAANLLLGAQPSEVAIKVLLEDVQAKLSGKPRTLSAITIMAITYLTDIFENAAKMEQSQRDEFLKANIDRFVAAEDPQPANRDFHLFHGVATLSKLMKLPEKPGDPLVDHLREVKKTAEEKLSSLYFVLNIPYLNVQDSGDQSKFKLNSRMGNSTYSGEFTPLETIYFGADAIFTGLRPVVSFKEGVLYFHNKEKGFLFPGVEVFRADKLDELKEREIPGLKVNMDAVSGLAAELEMKVYPYAAEKGFLNSQRADRKAVVLAVDTHSPVELLDVGMHNLKRLGYTDFRLLRGRDSSSFFPVLYKDTSGLPQELFKDALKRRGIIIHIKEKSADVYPPTGRPVKTKDLPLYPEIAKPLIVKNVLYRVSISYDAEKGFSGALEPVLKRIESEYGVSPFVYIKTERGVKSEALMEAAGIVSSLEGEPLENLDKLAAGLKCDPTKGGCVTHLPVLFPNVQTPPAPKEEVEMRTSLPPGFCDRDEVKRVILGRSGAYKACYEIELQRRPDLKGKIELRWVIDFDGSVRETTVLSDTMNNKVVVDCLIKNVRQLKFQKPEGGVCVIRWPFVFAPK